MAATCFNPPIGSEADIEIVFDVVLDERAEVIDATVREGWEPSEAAVRSALRAIQMCSPYRGMESLEVVATFSAHESVEIDPFD